MRVNNYKLKINIFFLGRHTVDKMIYRAIFVLSICNDTSICSSIFNGNMIHEVLFSSIYY